jgi:serine/threonine-protein kinase
LAVTVAGLGVSNAMISRRNSEIARKSAEVEGQRDQVKQALKQSEESREQAEAVSSFLVEAFRRADPEQDGREVKVADVLDRAEKTLDQSFNGSQKAKGTLLRRPEDRNLPRTELSCPAG